MKIIIGLGNPGRKFQRTRHNLGFRILDEFLKKNRFPKFRLSKKFKSLISKNSLNREKIILVKPQTFMNDSGKAVKSLIVQYFQKSRKIKAMAVIRRRFENLWVVHDDINLPLEKIRISKNRGAAGHKGVQSIVDELDTKNFIRFRIGIKPRTHSLKPKTLEKFVLRKFNKKEEEIVKKIIRKSTEAIEVALKEGLEKAMNKFNK
ncbi:MAG: aminoacyl-tRNA hydrolase [Candidatus Paceibacterales bacterium]